MPHNHKTTNFSWKKKHRHLWLFAGIGGISILIAGGWFWTNRQPDTPSLSEKRTGSMVHEKPSTLSDVLPDVRASSENARVSSPLPAPAPSPAEDVAAIPPEGSPSVDEFVPTAEQELHYQKTQMFIAEARENLPLVGIRAFNPIKAAENAYQSSVAEDRSEEADDAESIQRDDRGLQDGEVWIRINAANSREHREIMAQTADLYRTNTGFEGEVTVVVWVGGRPWVRETFVEVW